MGSSFTCDKRGVGPTLCLVVMIALVPGDTVSANAHIETPRVGQHIPDRDADGGWSVEWEAKAARLQQELESLRTENHKLTVEREIKNGSQRTLDHFLARHRATPRPLEFLSSEYQDSLGGASGIPKPLVKSTIPKIAEAVVTPHKKRGRLHDLRPSEQRAQRTTQWIDPETVQNILERSETKGFVAGTCGDFQEMPMGGNPTSQGHDQHMLRSKPNSVSGIWTVCVPEDFSSIAHAVTAAHGRDVRVEIQDGTYSWDGMLTLAREGTSFLQGARNTNLAGSVELTARQGGRICNLNLIQEFDSCITASAGAWEFHECKIQCSGQNAILDPEPHTTMSTAMYAVGSVQFHSTNCVVGGIDQERTASWGIFCCAESSSRSENCTIRLCEESALAGVDDSKLTVESCRIDLCIVGISVDDDAKADVRRCEFSGNDAALETGFTGHSGASMVLKDNKFRGVVWRSEDRPKRLDESGSVLAETEGISRRTRVPFSFHSQRAADVSEDDSSDLGIAEVDGPKNLHLVAQRALSRASHENHVRPLPPYETE